jgi:hypothetical protein
MGFAGLREFIEVVDSVGELRRTEGADQCLPANLSQG